MLDINYIRDNVEKVKEGVRHKKSNVDIDELLRIDSERRDLTSKLENLRAERNVASKNKDIEKGREIKNLIDELEPSLEETNKKFHHLMILIPNMPFEEVPVGNDDTENVVISKWGEPKEFDFEAKDHMELGESLALIDTETASKVSGARFTYLKNEAAILQFALINFAFKVLGDQNILKTLAQKVAPEFNPKPFIPVIPPVVIRPEVYIKMARLDPNQAEERYFLPKDDLYLIGSAEHTLGPLHMDEILPEKDLPIRYVGYSSAFRREAGSYGKDTKGILRLHQFDKVEMESFSLPENSSLEQDFIVLIQEHLMQALGLPYQVVMVCTGDMGGPDARQIDIETWIPSQHKYRETHSADLMTDYQSRRLNTRVKRPDGKTQLVHMNDATVFAIGRTLIAILENYQQSDGSVLIPEVLVPYTGFSVILPK